MPPRESAVNRAACPRSGLHNRDIIAAKYFRAIGPLLRRLHSHRDCPNRRLHYDQYAALILLYFLNPVLTSLRAIQQATELRKVRQKLGVPRVSLGSLSEAARVFDPALLTGLIKELASMTLAADACSRPRDLSKELEVIAFDSTLLHALPRAVCALRRDHGSRPAKLHLAFSPFRGVPTASTVVHAGAGDREVLGANLSSNALYILDAGYAGYALFDEILRARNSLVARVRGDATWRTVCERKLSVADRAAGVVLDQIAHLPSNRGRSARGSPMRVLKVILQPRIPRRPKRSCATRPADRSMELVLVTDLTDVSAETVATLYRLRWTIELFFRWFKCVLPFGHALSASENGLAIQVYCGLIASLLVSLWTGRKPTKRGLELVQLRVQGWADLDELAGYRCVSEKAKA